MLQKLKEPGTVCLVDRRSVGAFRDRKGKRLAVQRLQTGQGLGKLRLIKLVGDVVEGTDGDEAVAQGYLLTESVKLPNDREKVTALPAFFARRVSSSKRD